MRLITRILGIILMLTLSAHAQIGSYIGTPPAGVINTPILVNGTPVTLLYNAGAPSIPGAAYVTYKQGSAPTGVVTYTSTFTAVAGTTGSLLAMCDDTCTISVNGVQIGAITQYNTVKTFTIPALVSGTNTLSIAVTNAIGNTGVAFSGALTPPAITAVATYKISGGATLTILSDGTFNITGTGITAVKQ